MTKEEALEQMKWLKDLNASGYAGCDANGTIVDRRERPDACAINANPMFGVVEPKPLEGEKIAGDLALKFRKWLSDVTMTNPLIPIHIKYKMFLTQKNLK